MHIVYICFALGTERCECAICMRPLMKPALSCLVTSHNIIGLSFPPTCTIIEFPAECCSAVTN